MQQIITELQLVRANLTMALRNRKTISHELDQAKVDLQLAKQALNLTVAHKFGVEVSLIATVYLLGCRGGEARGGSLVLDTLQGQNTLPPGQVSILYT